MGDTRNDSSVTLANLVDANIATYAVICRLVSSHLTSKKRLSSIEDNMNEPGTAPVGALFMAQNLSF